MAGSAIALLADPQMYARVAAAAKSTVRTRFCADKIVPMYESYYEEVRAKQPK
jgi:hypothetical protein